MHLYNEVINKVFGATEEHAKQYNYFKRYFLSAMLYTCSNKNFKDIDDFCQSISNYLLMLYAEFKRGRTITTNYIPVAFFFTDTIIIKYDTFHKVLYFNDNYFISEMLIDSNEIDIRWGFGSLFHQFKH